MDVLDDMGRQQHGPAVFGESGEHASKAYAFLGVKSYCRLVYHKDFRIANQRLSNSDTSFHPA